MPPSPLVLREAARADIDAAVGYYLAEGAQAAALRFVDELQEALDHVRRHPESGSPRYAHELSLPGLRYWVLRTYPHLIFYVVRAEHIDVWRVLHGERDIPAWLR